MRLLPRLDNLDVSSLEPRFDLRPSECAIQRIAISSTWRRSRSTLGSDISAANDMLDITGVGQIRLKPVGIHIERRSFCPGATFDGNFLWPIGTGQQFGSALFTVDSAIA